MPVMASNVMSKVNGFDERNEAVINWFNNRITLIQMGKAKPLGLLPHMSEDDGVRSYEEWSHIEEEWKQNQDCRKRYQDVETWIDKYLPSGPHPAGSDRQKMLMAIRALLATRRRKSEGVLRFELDKRTSDKLRSVCDSEGLVYEAGGERKKHVPEALFLRCAVDVILEDSQLKEQVVSRVRFNLKRKDR